MIEIIKDIVGIKPIMEKDGSYSPSKLARVLGTMNKTNYEEFEYIKYQGKRKKIIVLLAEDSHYKMANGKKFSTGNHPVETLLPIMHLNNAGFDCICTTISGKPAQLEMWAFPEEDEQVKSKYLQVKSALQEPMSLEDLFSHEDLDPNEYAAVFIPGGHGAMIHLPRNKNVAKLLKWSYANDLFMISICHGPGAFFSTIKHHNEFLYNGYDMVVFLDGMDALLPKIGYLPGKMPESLSERLKENGANVLNALADNSVCLDRRLITGASPLAANDLGKLAALTLLTELD